jgi:acetylornithine deacetylase
MSDSHVNEGELTRLICDLVAIRSVNRAGRSDLSPSSAGMVAYLERWFHQHGIATSRGAVPGGEENLLATLPGPVGAPAIVFDAHSDTVPADDWADRAFAPQLRDGRIYGRGACDTKAAMAAMMLALAEAAAGPPLPSTIVFIASADEEFGRTGVAAFLNSKPKLDYAVVGEPTRCELVIACKGAARWDIVTSGKSAHTSTPHKGVNAITRMAAVIAAIDEYSRTVLAAKSHPLVDPATWTPSLITGGTAINVVPEACRLSVDLRTMPQEDPRAAMRDAQQFLNAKCSFPLRHENPRVWSGADVPPDHAFVRHCLRCRADALRSPSQHTDVLNASDLDAAQTVKGVNYGCHASDYSERSIPAVVIGPGDIAQAHAIDEYVDVASAQQAARTYLEIMRRPL